MRQSCESERAVPALCVWLAMLTGRLPARAGPDTRDLRLESDHRTPSLPSSRRRCRPRAPSSEIERYIRCIPLAKTIARSRNLGRETRTRGRSTRGILQALELE